MAKKTLYGKLLAVLVCSLLLIIPSTEAFARSRDKSHKREVVVVGHRKYHYSNGRFYRPGWFGFKLIIGTPPIGAVVTYLPFGHRTIVAGGLTYYYYDNVYYTACPTGYVIVPAPVVRSTPVVVAKAQKSSGETVVINVPNSNGSYTPVTLTKLGEGYVGPQGEYYAGNPTVDQLKALYGK